MLRLFKQLGCLFVVVLLFFSAETARCAETRPKPPIKVLLLFSWFKDMPWQKAIETGIRQKIAQKKIPVQLFVEYIEASRFPLSKTADGLYSLFKAKYADASIDMVVVENTPAAVLMKKTAEFFPKAQKLVVHSSGGAVPQLDKEPWRIVLRSNYLQNIKSMLEVWPAERIAVIADISDSHGKNRLAEFKKGLKTLGSNLPVIYLTDSSLQSIIDRAAKLPPKTAIFFLLYFRDEAGNRITPYRAAQKIVEKASAPIFTHWDTLMGSGVLGGFVLSGKKVGEMIGDAVFAHYENTPWRNESSLSVFENIYDWRQMEKWHIEKDQLPKDARILFYTPGIFESFPVEMTVLISLLALLVILSLSLSVQIRRKRIITQKLEQSREELNAIFMASPDPIVVFDAKGSALYHNPEFERRFGWETAQLKDWRFPFAAEASQGVLKAMLERVMNREGPIKIDIKGFSKKNTKLDIIASAAMIQGLDNGFAGAVLTLTDISEQKRLEEQVRQSQKMESIGTLAGGVAHDFNNILFAIIGYTELALDELPQLSPVRDNLDHVLESSLRARDLVSQLLAFGRKQVLKVKTFAINDLINQNQAMLHRIIGEDVELKTVLGEDAGYVRADFNQIEQVLLNLIANARDALPDGGVIIIETEKVYLDESYAVNHPEAEPGDYVMLSVNDNGLGIDASIIDKIFDPFFTTREMGKGTGMGLATVHGIVKQHGGTIYVYSEPGQGASFKVYLPFFEIEKDVFAKEAEPKGIVTGSETILLVEDEQVVRDFVAKALQKLGYHVIGAENGPEALELVDKTEEKIDLLLTDVIMPRMNGKELYDRLRQKDPELKVLFISGYSSNVIAHHGVLDAEVDLIQKPITIASLSTKLRRVLAG